ncbi:ABC transporter permease [Bacillus sp. V5-8f]|uniref:ABC transporter permease n=1 Tax=Bacillus sp. V5-8f TaxID=2053044 RepID=UPI000C7878AB|nr:ABC transporter permease [Bacillus sp. V5-8f]PLT33084.1 ribose ABC transporter permease [Bacillus sp. V5-8f]
MTPEIQKPKIAKAPLGEKNTLKQFRSILGQSQTIIFIGLVLLVLIFSYLSPHFMSFTNFMNIVRQTAMIAIVAFGMTYVIIAGEIDLSVGAIIGITGMTTAIGLQTGLNPFLIIIISLLIGAFIGLINGLMVVKVQVTAFLATLVTMSILRGMSLASSPGSAPITINSTVFVDLATMNIGPIPIVLIYLAAILLIAHYTLNKTVFGRHIYATGGGAHAASLAGVNVKRVKIMVFVISGLLSAFSGLILAGRLSAGLPDSGTGWELDAIAAAVLGGTKFSGGYGTVIGALGGALIIGVLSNGLTLLGMTYAYQLMIKGAIIGLAVVLDIWVRREEA